MLKGSSILDKLQGKAVLTGYVEGVSFENQEERFALPGANVILDPQTGAGADWYSRYLIEAVEPGYYVVTASMVGFVAESLAVDLKPNEVLIVNFALVEAEPIICEVEVVTRCSER